MKYKIQVKFDITGVAEVEADSPNEAYDKVRDDVDMTVNDVTIKSCYRRPDSFSILDENGTSHVYIDYGYME